MVEQSVVPNAITYSALISTCERGKQASAAWEVFVIRQQQGVTSDEITYSALISLYELG